MFFAILLLLVIVIFIIKYYQYYHRHSYMDFEQFNQYYCHPFASSISDGDSFSLSDIDMFHKCENDNNYHIKSNNDYLSISKYIQEFLCQNNEYVNRPGPVCPFVPGSLKQKSIYFFISSDQDNNKERLTKMIQQCKYDFLHKLKPIDGNKDKLAYKCLIILIRSSDVSHSLINEIQAELKLDFIIQHGLMFGEFHQSANSNSVRNESFYPTRTKVPLLVIRHMVAKDIVFLSQNQKLPLDIRKDIIKKYLNLYHLGLLYHSQIHHLQSANEILEELNPSVKE